MKQIIFLFLVFTSLFSFGQGGELNTSHPMANGTIRTCSGTFYDSGGFEGNYSNDENLVMTICPDEDDSFVVLDFFDFLTESNADVMNIFDGPDANSPWLGTYSADVIPGIIRASTGCLTITFQSDDQDTAPGWAAKITCVKECQTITPRFISSIPALDRAAERSCPEDVGLIKVCLGSPVTLTGGGDFEVSGENARYVWDFDNGTIGEGQTVTTTFERQGAYKVSLTIFDENGCQSTRILKVVVQVADNAADIVLSSDKESYCLGEPILLSSNVVLKSFEYIPTPPLAGTTFIPDGQGQTYSTTIPVKIYCDDQTLPAGSDLKVCINMEHSFLGDLNIALVAPNGTRVNLHAFSGGGGTTLGLPFHVNGANSQADVDLGPGRGETYCFTLDAAALLVNAPQLGPNILQTSGASRFMMAPGDYLPATTFDNFIGTRLNGNWTIEIQDRQAVDNGWIFWWSIELNPDLAPADLSFEPVIAEQKWLDAPGLFNNGDGSGAFVRPEAPGTYTYTYEVTDNFNCTYTESITVQVDPNVILREPIDLNQCKDDDGDAVFNLADVQASLSTNPDLVYTYYNSERDAIDDRDPIALTQNLNIADGPRTIWVRVVTADAVANCYALEHFNLVVNNCNLTLNPLPSLELCGADNVFNLDLQTPRVYNNTPGYTVTYYRNQQDALASRNPINDQDKLNFVGTNGQTIYVRVQSDVNPQNFGTTSFRLVINPNPIVPVVAAAIGCPVTENKLIANFQLSLNNLAFTGGAAFTEVTYFRTEIDAELGTSALVLPDNFISGATTIWVRIQNTRTGCYSVTSLELRIENLPAINTSLIVDYCDNNNDGIGEFNLNNVSVALLGTAVTPDLRITYYISAAHAQQSIFPLASPFVNNVPNQQVIYARIAFDRSKCFEIVPVTLRVTEKPRVVQPTPYVICVEQANREVMYDLTTKIPEILNGLNQASYNISFHVQEVHAERGILPINSPQNFSNTISAVAWVRVEDINTGCFSVVSISLRTSLMPTLPAQIASYVICDQPIENGFAVFDLEGRIAGIVGGQVGLSVSFHVNVVDANNNTRALPGNYQNIVAYNQTIFVRVQNIATGCFLVKPMNLKVVPLPVLNIPSTPVAICNSSNNGQGTFDLQSLVNSLQNGVLNVQINFYETQSNAQQDLDRIPNPRTYSNLNPNNPVVWVRGLNPVTGCFVVKPLFLRVVAAPLMPVVLDDIVLCSTEGATRAVFNLTVQTPVILSIQNNNNIADLVVSYYLSEDAARLGIASISGPTSYTNATNPQVIWVRVENIVSKCFAVGNFNIKVSAPLTLVHPTALVVCQESLPNTGVHVFDLTQRELEIQGGALIFGTEFKYYRSKDDAERNNNVITSPGSFTNTVNPQTIWIAVKNLAGCISYTSLTIRVAPLPEPNMTPKPLEICEGETNEGVGRFDLTLSQPDISNHNNNLRYEFYESEIEAIGGVRKIEFPDFYTSVSKTIWVKVFNGQEPGNTPCFSIVPLRLIVHAQPMINPLRPLMGCEQDTDGFFTFNLADKYDEILNGRNPNDFKIYFFFTRALADSGTTIPLALSYTNVVEGEQTIWVRMENKVTGCFYVAPLRLKVEEAVFAFDIKSPLVFCDNNDAVPVNDGFTRINLTVNNADIIGAQNVPANLLRVVYFASEQDFLNNRPIADPTQFINTSSPQTIIAVVRYIDPELFCEANINFQVIVHKRPELLPITGGYICEDLNSKEVTGFLIDTKLDSKLYNFIWKLNGEVIPGASLSYYEAKLPGTYTVSTTDKVTGCDSFNVITVVVTKIAPFSVTIDETVGNRDEISENGKQTIVVNVLDRKTPPGVYEFALDEGVYQNSNVFYDVTAGEHLVWVRDRLTGACAVSKLVSVMNYPKFFTPNGDGHNDTWNIKGLSSQPDAKIYIFDRFGKLLKQVSPAGEGWDGTFGGRPVPSTDYWFTVEYNDLQGNRREFKGHFSLKR